MAYYDASCNASVQQGFEFWVNSVTGDDNNDGTELNPFKTLLCALTVLPPDPTAGCRIYLMGAGPYSLPSTLNGVYPTGPYGQPLMICGDTMAVITTDTVQSTSGASVTPMASMTTDQYRGFIYHGLSGSSAGQFYQIANNSPTQLFSIGNTFSAAPGDTFEILRPATVLTATNLTIYGPGKVGFWRCKIVAENLEVLTNASTLWDACEIVLSNRFSGRSQSICQFNSTASSTDFSIIKDIGTQSGKVGAFFNNPTVFAANAIRMFDGSTGRGYLITRGGLDTWSAGHWFLLGTDIDLTGGVNSSGIISQAGGTLEINTGYHRLVLGGTNGIGIAVEQRAFASLSAATISITQAGTAGILVSGGGVLHMDHVDGSAGNGYGIRVNPGGMLLNNGQNTISGSLGDVLIAPDSTPTEWASVGDVVLST